MIAAEFHTWQMKETQSEDGGLLARNPVQHLSVKNQKLVTMQKGLNETISAGYCGMNRVQYLAKSVLDEPVKVMKFVMVLPIMNLGRRCIMLESVIGMLTILNTGMIKISIKIYSDFFFFDFRELQAPRRPAISRYGRAATVSRPNPATPPPP